ncbi:MAG: hypothetical protein ABR512_08535 [Desulfopila sp.]
MAPTVQEFDILSPELEKLGDEAFNGCLPALQLLHEFRQGDRSSPVFQNGMKLLDTIEFIHEKP